MDVCLLIDRAGHPVLTATLSVLCARNETRILIAAGLDADTIRRELASPADIYLLKSRSPAALELGQQLERRGSTVLNTAASTSACLDRELLSARVAEVGLSGPRTQAFARFGHLRESAASGRVTFPSLVKSRRSRRGDLVRRFDSAQELRALGCEWDAEPVVLQEFIEGDGWDVKLWVIGETVHAARRRSALVTGAVGDAKRNLPIAPADLPEEWRRIALHVGRAFGLELYGVDLLPCERGALVVDVNPFPGFRGVPDAPAALAQLITRRAPAAVGRG